jgi:hypothetical protein
MAPNSLSPASVVISSHSAFGAHKMTIPTKEWFPTSITGVLGSYESWLGGPVDAEDMVTDLCTVLKPFMPATSEFDSVTVYTQATPTAPNIPRASVALGIVGTSASANPSAAFSATFHFVTQAFGKAKLVVLDSPFGANWLAPLLPAGFSAAVIALEAEFSDSNNAWSGRDDSPPVSCVKVTYDVNDKLQREYFGS